MSGIDKQIEDAVLAQLEETFEGYEYEVTLKPFVATRDEETIAVKYPCVMFACDPFAPAAPDCPLGEVVMRISVRTSSDDDPACVRLTQVFDAVTDAITADLIGPRIMDPWGLSKIDNTPPGAPSIDPEARHQDKGKEYKFKVVRTDS